MSSLGSILQWDYSSACHICLECGHLMGTMTTDASLYPRHQLHNLRYSRCLRRGFPGCSAVKKNPPANARDSGLISGLGRSSGEGNGNPLQYSCLGNPMNRGAWWAIVHGNANSTWLSEHSRARRYVLEGCAAALGLSSFPLPPFQTQGLSY